MECVFSTPPVRRLCRHCGPLSVAIIRSQTCQAWQVTWIHIYTFYIILYSHITMSIYLIIYHSRCPSKSPSAYLDSRFCIHLLYPSIFTYLELRPRHRQTERTDDRACAYRLPRNHRLCIHQHWYLGGNSPIAAANTVSQPKHATTATTFQSFHIYNLQPEPHTHPKKQGELEIWKKNAATFDQRTTSGAGGPASFTGGAASPVSRASVGA